MGLFKAKILMGFFTPQYRFIVFLLVILNSIYKKLFLGFSVSLLMILINFLFFILFIESLSEIILSSHLNKKQSKYIIKRLGIITAPIAILSISSFFLSNPTSWSTLILLSLSAYLIVFKLTNSTRFSFLLMWALFFISIVTLKPNFDAGYFSFFISTFLALFIQRNSENNLNIRVEDEQLDLIKEKNKEWLNKVKETFFKSYPVVLFENKLYFKSDGFLVNSVGERVNDKNKIQSLEKLLELKNKFLEIRLNYAKHHYINIGFSKRAVDFWLNNPEKMNKLKMFKFLDHSFFTLVTIFIFNPKMSQRIAKEVYYNYKDFENLSEDSKFLWFSDMQLRIIALQSEDDSFKIFKSLSLFDELPSQEKINLIRDKINEYESNKISLNYKKLIEKRIKEASKLHKNRKRVMKSFSKLGKPFKMQEKFNEDIKNIISKYFQS